jgi:hypothetical protein
MKKSDLNKPIRRFHIRQRLSQSLLAVTLSALFVSSSFAQVVLSPLWQVSTTNAAAYTNLAGTPYINTDGTQRGLAYNPTTNHIYVVSRTGGHQVYIIDAFTGAPVGQLDVTGVSGGGGAALNLVDVSDDGQIFICNLATSEGTFRLYRYANETSAPVLVFLGDPAAGDTNAPVANSKRFGDNLTVRGSGTNVQVLVNSRGGRTSGLLYPTDDTYATFASQVILTDAANGGLGIGAAFGPGNSYWGKAPTTTLRRLVIANPADIYNTGVALVATSIVNQTIAQGSTAPIGTLSSSNLLALIDYGAHTVRLYDTTFGTNLFQDAKSFPLPATANGNGTGAVDFGTKNGTNYVWALDSNNGLAAFAIVPVAAPIIGTQPANVAILNGGYGSLVATANGTAPITYRWYQANTNTLTTNLVATSTASGTLNLTNVTFATAGLYSVIASNNAGQATSTVAVVTITPSVLTSVADKLWQLLPGSRSYLAVDNNQRGLAFNPVNNHVYVVNRTGGNSVNIVNGTTGADLGSLDLTGVGGQVGEQFPINMVGVAQDGAIYVCNLANVTSGGAFTIYRWSDDAPTTQATIAYGPDSPAGTRIGDAFAVTGSGVNTRLIASTRNGTVVVVFTTSDGVNFSPNIVDVTEAPAGFAGLGLTAGGPDTFWATSSGGFSLRKVFYDIENGTNSVLLSLAGQSGFNIGADSQNDFVASIGTSDTPSNVRLLDVFNATTQAVLVDQEFFAADNANIGGTGAVAFDVAGGRIFALDTNNGLLALKYAPRVKQAGNVITWTGPGSLQASAVVTGTYTNVTGATSPYVSPTASSLFYRVQR